VRTVYVFAFFQSGTPAGFVAVGVEFALFPTVAVLAEQTVAACVDVIADCVFAVPLVTLLLLVLVLLWFAAIVLPIVGKDAVIPRMVWLVVRTPHRLEMEHVKVAVFLKAVNQVD
jgi:hypothetical protein